MSSRGLTCSPDPKARGALPVDPEGSAGRLRLEPEGPRRPPGRPRRIGWQVVPPTRGPAERASEIPRDHRTFAPRTRRSAARPPFPKERRAGVPLLQRTAKRLTECDGLDLTASSLGRPPHHRRLRRVAPPAWPTLLADPVPVAEGVRRFLGEKHPAPQGFSRTSSDDHGLRGVSSACRLEGASQTSCQHFLSTECSTEWSPACPHGGDANGPVRGLASHAPLLTLLPRGSVRPDPRDLPGATR